MFWNGSTAIDGLSGRASGTSTGDVRRRDCRGRRGLPISRVPFHSERLHRPLDVLKREAPEVVELRLDPVADEIMHCARDHDATRRRFALQPRRHVDAIAVEVVAVDDQVAQVQADAEHNGSILGLILVGLGHGLLELDGGAQRINRAGELDQSPVASQLDQPPSMTRQYRLQTLLSDGPCRRASVLLSSRPIRRE